MRVLPSLLLLLTALPFAANATGTITVPKKLNFQKDAHIPDAVRKECGLEEKTAEAVRNVLTGKFDKVESADNVSAKTPGKALELRIAAVLAPGGGPFSGPKSLTLTGTLWENGKALGNFTAGRYTTRGHGTCGMLERNAKEIAQDIAKWITAPSKDALLGDAKK